MSRRPRRQRLGPCLEAWEFLDLAERPNAIEEIVSLQERRIAGVDQRIAWTVEEWPAALLFERLFEPVERDGNLRHRRVVGGRIVRIGAAGDALRESRDVVGPGAVDGA